MCTNNLFLTNPFKGRVRSSTAAGPRTMPKKPKFSRVKVAFSFLPFSNDHRRTAFRFHYGRPHFLFLNHANLHAATVFFIRPMFSSVFYPGLVSFFICNRPANNAIPATELTSNFSAFGANKIF